MSSALTGEKRSAFLPGTQTFVEQGFTDTIYRTRVWAALAAPRDLPAAISNRMVDAVHAAIRMPETTRFIHEVGFEVIGNGPEKFAQRFREEFLLITQMIRDMGIEPQ